MPITIIGILDEREESLRILKSCIEPYLLLPIVWAMRKAVTDFGWYWRPR